MNAKKKLGVFGVKYFPSKGGTSRVAEGLIRELKDEYDITIYCYKDPAAEGYIPGVKVIQFAKLPGGAAGVFVYMFFSCLHMLFTKRYDLVHVHKTDAAFFIPFLRIKFKVIATSHEAPYNRDKWNALGKTYFKFVERVFVFSGATLTSVSQPLADFYYSKYKKLVHYVPNGVSLYTERDDAGAKELLAQHGIQGEYLLFAARRIMSTKGLHTFLEAMKKIDYDGNIVIAGEETHGSSYLDKIDALSEGMKVTRVGFVKGKALLMSLVEQAKMFVFPSETEGLSIMLLEVGSTGKTPLICSDIPENTQVFNDQHVLYFKNKEVDDLVEKFQWAEANPDSMKEKMANARRHVLEEFSETRTAQRYDELYRQMLGLPPRSKEKEREMEADVV